MGEKTLCRLEVVRGRETGSFPPDLSPQGASPGGFPSRPGLPPSQPPTVSAWLLVTFQPWLAADCPLPGSSKLQETNKMSPNEWMALQ